MKHWVCFWLHASVSSVMLPVNDLLIINDSMLQFNYLTCWSTEFPRKCEVLLLTVVVSYSVKCFEHNYCCSSFSTFILELQNSSNLFSSYFNLQIRVFIVFLFFLMDVSNARINYHPSHSAWVSVAHYCHNILYNLGVISHSQTLRSLMSTASRGHRDY